jgi:2-dehydro-3-deoxyglucarate aldolase/4-hydroxy-2-oxoheptanedioate aldolase
MINFRQRLAKGAPLVGTILTLPVPELVEMCARADFDYLWLDMEHGLFDIAALQRGVIAAGNVPCLARVPVNEEAWIKRALDSGVAGLIIPQVNTAEAARSAVRATRYPPQGARSVGIGRAQGYGADFAQYVARANAEIALLVQIEHVQAVENLEVILAVEGIDGLVIGPYDLSASLGMPGRLDDPQVVALIERVLRVCQERGMPVGIFSADASGARRALQAGYRLVAAGLDSLVFSTAVRKLRREITVPAL